MRLALVRGPQMSPYEMQTFAPLRDLGWELTGFTSRHPMNEEVPGLDLVRLSSPWDGVNRSRGLVRKAREAVAYKTGRISRLDGLESALHGFDIIHSMETYNAFTGQALDGAHVQKKPLVVTVWENVPFLPVEKPLDAIRRRVLREADAFVAVTERAKAALLVEGAPDDRFRPEAPTRDLRREHAIPSDAPLFASIARLVWEKGLLDVLHALKLLALRGEQDAHLLVVGVGPDRALAQARARELGIADRVHFAGGLPYAQIQRVYQAADALVLGSIPTPRWQEQYGMVLVEAMACGTPVVAAASGSIPDVVGDAGLLVQPNDPLAMAGALAQMADPATRAEHAKRGIERARERYDRRRVAQRLDALYRTLLA
jgi:glycosyltransferase involved in cell wall biosynthesis